MDVLPLTSQKKNKRHRTQVTAPEAIMALLFVCGHYPNMFPQSFWKQTKLFLEFLIPQAFNLNYLIDWDSKIKMYVLRYRMLNNST